MWPPEPVLADAPPHGFLTSFPFPAVYPADFFPADAMDPLQDALAAKEEALAAMAQVKAQLEVAQRETDAAIAEARVSKLAAAAAVARAGALEATAHDQVTEAHLEAAKAHEQAAASREEAKSALARRHDTVKRLTTAALQPGVLETIVANGSGAGSAVGGVGSAVGGCVGVKATSSGAGGYARQRSNSLTPPVTAAPVKGSPLAAPRVSSSPQPNFALVSRRSIHGALPGRVATPNTPAAQVGEEESEERGEEDDDEYVDEEGEEQEDELSFRRSDRMSERMPEELARLRIATSDPASHTTRSHSQSLLQRWSRRLAWRPSRKSTSSQQRPSTQRPSTRVSSVFTPPRTPPHSAGKVGGGGGSRAPPPEMMAHSTSADAGGFGLERQSKTSEQLRDFVRTHSWRRDPARELAYPHETVEHVAWRAGSELHTAEPSATWTTGESICDATAALDAPGETPAPEERKRAAVLARLGEYAIAMDTVGASAPTPPRGRQPSYTTKAMLTTDNPYGGRSSTYTSQLNWLSAAERERESVLREWE